MTTVVSTSRESEHEVKSIVSLLAWRWGFRKMGIISQSIVYSVYKGALRIQNACPMMLQFRFSPHLPAGAAASTVPGFSTASAGLPTVSGLFWTRRWEKNK